MKEYDLIKAIAGFFPRSKLQVNGLFESDAEILRIGGELWGLTMDEFSPEADLFTMEDPSILGSNLAVATLSDLLAVGAEPKFFMHSVSLPVNVERAFVDGMMKGISSILAGLDCAMCGGDMGTANPWRYCGFAMGKISTGRAVSRQLAHESQTLWVTGRLGDANLAALQNMPTPRFELRGREAELIRRYGSGCIDTSGGLFDALWLLHQQNPRLRFDISMNDVPMAEGVKAAAAAKGFPAEAALLGGAGEYELLFAVSDRFENEFRSQLSQAIDVTLIGTVCADEKGGVHLRSDGREVLMTEAPPCPRSAVSAEQYMTEVMTMAHHLFGAGVRS